jgi:uncharacterized cupin superfamily protein
MLHVEPANGTDLSAKAILARHSERRLTAEELVVVLDGRPSLRTPDGWRELHEGEVVPFLRSDSRYRAGTFS